ncbi:MAG: hypothetical protein EXR84_08405 [Gammaproteobacteria bacterium]|nr:hypothetical protein [Gammaproteobacteria bacterium]
MHDIVDLEARGLPSGFVASREFIEAAAAQGKSLGIKPASLFVAHPIQDRTDAEMAQLARAAMQGVIALVCDQKSD